MLESWDCSQASAIQSSTRYTSFAYCNTIWFKLSLLLIWTISIGKFPVKLLYTSNMPLLMYAAVVGNVYIVTQASHTHIHSSYRYDGLTYSVIWYMYLCAIHMQMVNAALPSSFITLLTGRWTLLENSGMTTTTTTTILYLPILYLCTHIFKQSFTNSSCLMYIYISIVNII